MLILDDMLAVAYSSVRKELALVAFDVIDRFHVSSEKSQHQRQTTEAVTWKYWLLLLAKLRISELNAWNKYDTEFNISLRVQLRGWFEYVNTTFLQLRSTLVHSAMCTT